MVILHNFMGTGDIMLSKNIQTMNNVTVRRQLPEVQFCFIMAACGLSRKTFHELFKLGAPTLRFDRFHTD